jgi:hypothetical protein
MKTTRVRSVTNEKKLVLFWDDRRASTAQGGSQREIKAD